MNKVFTKFRCQNWRPCFGVRFSWHYFLFSAPYNTNRTIIIYWLCYWWTVVNSSWVFETQFVTLPYDICFFNPVFLVAYCIAPSCSSPYGTRHGNEHERDARIVPTEHTIGQETGELQYPRQASTSLEPLLMADELEPSGVQSNRHTDPVSRNIRRLREISDSLFEEGDSLFNTYVSMQCYEVFNDRWNNGFIRGRLGVN